MKFINDRLQMLYKCYKKKFLRKFNFFFTSYVQVTCKKSLFIWSFILSVDIKLVLKDIYVNVD